MFILKGCVGIKSEFYTLKGYQIKNSHNITEAMEDYIEMIYRKTLDNNFISIKDLSFYLNVRPSSSSKMCNRLKELNLIEFEKYGLISLKDDGKYLGKYLLERHEILTQFFKYINKEKYKLEQVEKIEHFIDYDTIINIKNFISNKNNF